MAIFKWLPVLLLVTSAAFAQNTTLHKAPAPLFRDPVTDGAADPSIFWNREEKSWWMVYSQRRANTEAEDVSYCYGTAIGIASSSDNGKTWVYRGTLNLQIDKGMNTFWAPDVQYFNGKYHLFVTYIEGVRTHWGGRARMSHFTSTDLWNWQLVDFPKLTSEDVIDATLFQLPNKTWRMWYKDSKNPVGNMLMAESKDLQHWQTHDQPLFPGHGQEGPKVFSFNGYYWLLTDEWAGMRVYRSTDLDHWEKQQRVLDVPGKRPEDTPTGAHGDVIVVNNKAYIFYFTHPGRKSHGEAPAGPNGIIPFDLRRSSIQVAELVFENGTLTCNRDAPFDFWLPNE
ncbi:family 43 glycosylhydrolase [Deminuibacter soli]|uniref:Glycosyl hydrolase n=1 Tax=Deminuibacter soli TaxID=2291815 RepID=A0A3E1NL22_9BACT|nr:family 43 glycosylhydrolase [Deminuibacter soli]RFM28488.1 glycosyl hydrolase [Deminuibacter soli]